MVDFRPFRGIRYDLAVAGDMADLVCPPYDVISPDQERALLKRSPSNMVRLELAELPGAPPAGRYEGAARAFATFQESGVLRRDLQPAYYVLRQRFAGAAGRMERVGLLGAMRLEAFGTSVLPHEDTRTGPKEDRFALMEATEANFSPPMMLYRDPSGRVAGAIEQVMAGRADADFSVEGGEYTLWSVSDSETARTVHEALESQAVYVADGHHRYETALAYRDGHEAGAGGDAASRFVMTCLIEFDDPGLRILPYYRILHGLDGGQLRELRARMDNLFESSPAGVPPESGPLDAVVAAASQGRVALGVVEPGQAPSLLRPKAGMVPSPDPAASPADQAKAVEAVVLQEMVLRPVLGDSFADHVAYVHDGNEAVREVASGRGQIAFFVKGVPADVFEAVVGAGIRLPAKSTYFHPKLPSGLVISSLAGDL